MGQIKLNQEEKSHSVRVLWRYYLFFLYFSGLFHLVLMASGFTNTVGLRQAIYMSALWLIPLLLIPRFSKKLALLFGLILWLGSLVNWGYLFLYGQEFSNSVLYIIFESNFSESKEFIESYYQWWMLPALIIYSGIGYLIWAKLKPLPSMGLKRVPIIVSLVILVGWPFINQTFIKQSGLESAIDKQVVRMEPAVPWNLVMGYISYKKILVKIEEQLLVNKNIPPLEGLIEKNAMDNKTLVLVIGESTNRQRMGIYGYQRNTTPHLSELKNELLLFDNVYAPRPYTIETLEQVLTFADEQNPDLYLTRPNIINMMKQAGYKTYWITNQQTQTKRNTLLTTFSKQADEQIYLNNNRAQDSAQYDESVLIPFEKVLKKPEAKKFIVVHLLGTHRKYHYRYPESYDFFTGDDNVTEGLSQSQRQEYNEYDNAVLYNDYVVSELVNQLKHSDQNALLTYFSDHGEEVYDNPQDLFAGRNEGKPTSNMYTIPFIIWQSKSWKRSVLGIHGDDITHRPYSTSNFIYTWSDLSGIYYDDHLESSSLVNSGFKPGPIWIGDPSRPDKLRNLLKSPFDDIPGYPSDYQHFSKKNSDDGKQKTAI